MNLRKKIRRLEYLCSIIGTGPSDAVFSIEKEIQQCEDTLKKDYLKGSSLKYISDRCELLKLFKELSYTDEKAKLYWLNTWWAYRKKSYQYKKKPIPVKKDNINLYGEEFKGYGTPRQPRKCRKTAWKRFKKLFPKHNIT